MDCSIVNSLNSEKIKIKKEISTSICYVSYEYTPGANNNVIFEIVIHKNLCSDFLTNNSIEKQKLTELVSDAINSILSSITFFPTSAIYTSEEKIFNNTLTFQAQCYALFPPIINLEDFHIEFKNSLQHEELSSKELMLERLMCKLELLIPNELPDKFYKDHFDTIGAISTWKRGLAVEYILECPELIQIKNMPADKKRLEALLKFIIHM